MLISLSRNGVTCRALPSLLPSDPCRERGWIKMNGMMSSYELRP